ncbi:MAG: M61 family peptidase [Rhodanobacteraceae bacterium]
MRRGRLSAPLALVCVLWGVLLCPPVAAKDSVHTDRPQSEPIDLHVDLSRAADRIFQVHETIAVTPGPLTLRYANWIPGQHGLSGPISNVAGLVIRARDTKLAWRRDLRDMYSVHVGVPKGVTRIKLSFQYLAGSRRDGAPVGPAVGRDLAVLEANKVVLYPAGPDARQISVRPSFVLPAGWKFASALELNGRDDNTLHFKPLSLDQLVDSPLLYGRHLNSVELGRAHGAPVRLRIMGERGVDIHPDQKQLESLRELATQMLALFQRPHYQHYDFLLSLSDRMGHFGLEHLQSSDDRLPASFLSSPALFRVLAPLLPHQWVHSWNGKFRFPADLWSADFSSVEQTDLLWVYEGLTEYWAAVLSARSGLWTPAYFRAALASNASLLAHRSGRNWRSLQDTADAAQLAWEGSRDWSNWRRSADFYPEGQLLWLDVDTTIRQLSDNRHSLDELAPRFFGSMLTGTRARGYDFQDVVDALNAIQPHDWASFLRQRLDYTGDKLPYHGIEKSGWKLTYTGALGDRDQDMLDLGHGANLAASIGFAVAADGRVRDVQWQGPASAAGLVPGMTVVAVDGKKFSIDVLTRAISAAAKTKAGIALLVRDQGLYRTLEIEYHRGLRYPHLERVAGTPDLLGDIIKPRHQEREREKHKRP